MRLRRDRTLRARVKLGALLAVLALSALGQKSKKDCCTNPEDGQQEPQFYHYYVTASPTVIYVKEGGQAVPVQIKASCEGPAGCLAAAMPLTIQYSKAYLQVQGSLTSADTTLSISGLVHKMDGKSNTGNLVESQVGDWHVVKLGISLPEDQYATSEGAWIDVWIQRSEGPPPPPLRRSDSDLPNLLLVQAGLGLDFGVVEIGKTSQQSLIIGNTGAQDLIITGWSFDNPSPSDTDGYFSVMVTPPLVIPPSGGMRVPVQFLPRAAPKAGESDEVKATLRFGSNSAPAFDLRPHYLTVKGKRKISVAASGQATPSSRQGRPAD